MKTYFSLKLNFKPTCQRIVIVLKTNFYLIVGYTERTCYNTSNSQKVENLVSRHFVLLFPLEFEVLYFERRIGENLYLARVEKLK